MIKSLFIVGIIGITSLSSSLAADEERSFPVYKVDQDYISSLPRQYVALTFDDGPSEYTKVIADILSERGSSWDILFYR
ncbi:polysaccharide deacetylase family protein [Piscibacillus salipiscarius]|uniref:polysaccharide deacetylase family protein n=1 Tax=Piscibacillus salipiscarius TaxID=299480 RepID=UPI0024371CA0|nr:polysaccharide deacetylase family protein [Piscibacillus salipiscarius]